MSDLEQIAIIRLQEAARMSERYYGLPLVVTTSGGKDSSVCVELARRAGINFEIMHNHTTADAPETVRFLRSEFKRLEADGRKIIINYPEYKGKRTSLWELIPQKLMPPTRLSRYCCAILKERGGAGRYITTGVRWAESNARRKRGIYETIHANPSKKIVLNNDNDDRRRLFERCELRHKAVCNPIIDWTDHDVWDFLTSENIPVNPVYDYGFTRCGCVGCPSANKIRYKEFARWPKFQNMWIMAFDNMLKVRQSKGLPTSWNNKEDDFHWWMEDGALPGQIEFDDLDDMEDYEDE